MEFYNNETKFHSNMKGMKKSKCLYCGDGFFAYIKSNFCSKRCKSLYKKEKLKNIKK